MDWKLPLQCSNKELFSLALNKTRKAPPLNLVTRAATEAGALAFALAALAVAMLYTTFGSVGGVLVPAVALGLVGGVTVFLSVWAIVSGRFPGKKPVLGARRGSAIAVLAVVVVASVHSFFTFGSGGLLYSLVGQVGYACVFGGGPAAAFGALLGYLVERRHFSGRGA
jgi:hypothetical protein